MMSQLPSVAPPSLLFVVYCISSCRFLDIILGTDGPWAQSKDGAAALGNLRKLLGNL